MSLFYLLFFKDPTDRDVINCDQYLEQIFNRKKMRFMEIPQCLQQMLYPPDPLVLNHIVKRDPEKQVTCYDIEVEIDDPVKYHASTFLQNHMNVPDISLLDQRVIIMNLQAFTTIKSRYMT
jgi:SWI/SNF-related matrix-associated actin-dependent regulator of chromatin subfamily D